MPVGLEVYFKHILGLIEILGISKSYLNFILKSSLIMFHCWKTQKNWLKEGGREISEFDQGTVVCLIICYMFDMVIGKGLPKLNVT